MRMNDYTVRLLLYISIYIYNIYIIVKLTTCNGHELGWVIHVVISEFFFVTGRSFKCS